MIPPEVATEELEDAESDAANEGGVEIGLGVEQGKLALANLRQEVEGAAVAGRAQRPGWSSDAYSRGSRRAFGVGPWWGRGCRTWAVRSGRRDGRRGSRDRGVAVFHAEVAPGPEPSREVLAGRGIRPASSPGSGRASRPARRRLFQRTLPGRALRFPPRHGCSDRSGSGLRRELPRGCLGAPRSSSRVCVEPLRLPAGAPGAEPARSRALGWHQLDFERGRETLGLEQSESHDAEKEDRMQRKRDDRREREVARPISQRQGCLPPVSFAPESIKSPPCNHPSPFRGRPGRALARAGYRASATPGCALAPGTGPGPLWKNGGWEDGILRGFQPGSLPGPR